MRFNHKQQQQVEELCGAAIRAQTGLPDLYHRGRTLFLAGRRIAFDAPHLQTDPLEQDFRSQRGIADGIAQRLQYSNPEMHRSFRPKNALQALIFDLLEQLRVEALVREEYPGIKSNLNYRFRLWSLRFHQARHTDTQVGLLIYTLAQMCWSRLNACPTLEQTDDLIEGTRANIAPILGHDLAGLRQHCTDQAGYAQHALAIAKIVEASSSAVSAAQGGQKGDPVDTEEALSRITLALDFSDEAEDSNIASIITGTSKVFTAQAYQYRVFSRIYDREIRPASSIRKAELVEFRDRLDHLIQAQGINIPRLARQISELLANPARDGWQFGEEQGVIDGRRLSQIVSSPSERRVFRTDRYRLKNDCLVSFLIDCSGSMKQYIEPIAMMVDIFGRALDQTEIASEILGFSTASWNGGRCYQQWVTQGRPANPGRLNEQNHLIFKPADSPWRRSRRDIAALLKTPNFREGIDGEAVDWACQRMRKRSERRKILIVISDGSPMDSATHMANDEFYLDNHLRQVVERNESGSEIEIYGLGVGLSLTPYYRHSLAIDLGESIGNALFRQILHMIAQATRR